MSYSLETKFEIWNDKTGARLEVGPDRDGLDLIEIRQYTDDGQIANRLTVTLEEIPHLLIAFRHFVSE